MPQTEFTPERLAALLRGALADPTALNAAAAAAKAAGVADAAERLADLVLEIARASSATLNCSASTLGLTDSRLDDPDRGAERQALAALIGRQRGADFPSGGCARFVGLTLDGAARRADRQRRLQRRFESSTSGEVDLDIVWGQRDLGETRGGEDAPHARFIGEGERAGVVGAELGQARRAAQRRPQRDHLPEVAPRLAPAGEDRAPAARQRPAQVRTRRSAR